MSYHEYTTADVDFQDLMAEVKAALPAAMFTGAFNGVVGLTFTPDLSAGDTTTLDGVVTAHKAAAAARALARAKKAKYAEIDAHTDELIALGFLHSGKMFSLSLEAQINWTNIGFNPSLLTYPYKIATLMDDQIHEFADAAEIQTAYGEAVGTKEARISSGRDLKEQVLAATTVAEVDAVVDNRT